MNRLGEPIAAAEGFEDRLGETHRREASDRLPVFDVQTAVARQARHGRFRRIEQPVDVVKAVHPDPAPSPPTSSLKVFVPPSMCR